MFATFDDVVRFHGHSCPGLAIGFRMTCAALESLQSRRSEDEELVAIVENDACGVDALQFVAGCTVGKGNLVHRDYGKHVYTLYSRTTGRGVRVAFHGRGIPPGLRDDREAFTRWLLEAPADALVSVTDITIDEPELARVHRSVTCAVCGEAVMETRVLELDGEQLCMPCALKVAKR